MVAAAAAERLAWHGEYEPEDDAEYSEKEWAEWELEQNKKITEAQEELNWLGARGKGGKAAKGGKGKGKGGGGKGYGGKGGGKGKGKGSSACSWCGEEGHWRADCAALKKHKSDMDEDRKNKGLPAFVPRPRPAYSLS